MLHSCVGSAAVARQLPVALQKKVVVVVVAQEVVVVVVEFVGYHSIRCLSLFFISNVSNRSLSSFMVSINLYTLAVSPSLGGSRQHKEKTKTMGV